MFIVYLPTDFPLSLRAIGGIVGCVWVYMLRYCWEYGDEKTRIN